MPLKIYLDQGHNPDNPNAGAEGNGFREQDLVYAIGQRTAAMLRGYGFDVKLSRPTPGTQLGTSVATSLAARVNEANDWDADYFISLHCNASDVTAASGSEAFVFRRDSEAEWLAWRLLEGVTDATGLENRGIFARPSLYVLRKTRMPAVLMELGFITNPEDAALLAYSPNLFAEGLTNGILAYLGRQE
ncbi:MAG: N-acetylmuramoyl-L-alanine amidase [Clostridia bacterium]|nr:N-acetylmuramoyl-L-alanine amidase [Clostridia bacterium]MBQ5354408.1 N-acetylmuramoyl-L-alanine amidase [Clostridia bacterium]